MIQDHPMNITQDQIEMLASNLPFLEIFSLCCIPLDISTLTFLALLPFAWHCLNLHGLGLYINAHTIDILTPLSVSVAATSSSLPYNLKGFEKLNQLCLGFSQIQDEVAVAMFLSCLCPLGCKIESLMSIFPDSEESPQAHNSGNNLTSVDSPMEGVLDEITRRCTKWEEVGRLLPILTRVRKEERERYRVLEVEVEELRNRKDPAVSQQANRNWN